LTNSTLKFKSVVKDRLFYDRFEYCISFGLQEIDCLRNQDFDCVQISRTIDRRREWRETAQQRWATLHKNTSTHQPILTHRWNEITNEVEQNLYDFAEILRNSGVDFKLVVSNNYGWVYTNDLNLIGQLKQLRMLTGKRYSRAVVDRPKNTIRLKNPQHQFRSYLKITKITNQQKDNLINFLNNQQASIRISPALAEWMVSSFHRTQDYFFVDHTELSWLTMLALVQPGIIRKTQQIIPAK
jgi:hypothetical protein